MSITDITLTATVAAPPLSSNDHSREQVLSEYSHNAQRLLRADSIFKTNKPKSGLCFYPTDLSTLQNDWYYPGPWERDDEGEKDVEEFKRLIPGKIEYDVRSVKIARRFLKELGCQDACISKYALWAQGFCARGATSLYDLLNGRT